jgi:hypothetical protein
MPALKRHNLAKVVQPQEGRLPAMPRKTDLRTGRGGDVLDDVFFQRMFPLKKTENTYISSS